MNSSDQAAMPRLEPGVPWAERTVPGLVQRRASETPAADCLTIDDVTWTCADTREQARRFAAALVDAGVLPGDRVVLLCGNSAPFVQGLLGATWMGAVVVPVNTAFRGEQLTHVLQNADPSIVICEMEILPAVSEAWSAQPRSLPVWVVGRTAPAANGLHTPGLDVRPFPDPFPEPGRLLEDRPVRPQDMAAILYTSGTSGMSKGVCCPHAQLFWWASNTVRHLEIASHDVLHTTLPLFHVNALGTLAQGLLSGAHVVVRRRFSASRFWEELVSSQASVTYLLGAMVPILLSREPTDLENAHRVRHALAPAVPAAAHGPWLERTGIRLLDGYGSTETNFVIAASPEAQRPGLMGTCQAGFDTRVVDTGDQPVPDGVPGELVVRSDEPYSMATGYFRMDEQTVRAWRNLWFHTGDRVIRHPDGWFEFVDRLSDSIRRRGENISSTEVERAVGSHPGVERVAVYPVPSELGEDDVMAAVVVRSGMTLDPLDLVRHCEGRLAYFAVPRYIRAVDVLPLTENGKVRKAHLREQGVTDRTWDLHSSGYTVTRPG